MTGAREAAGADPVITEAEATSWLERYGRAWENGDAEAILELFSEDGSYRVTPFETPMVGHDAIRTYWLENPGTHIGVQFSFRVWAIIGDQCFAHWTSKFVKGDRRLELDGAFRLIFGRDSKRGPLCHALEEWWHERESSA